MDRAESTENSGPVKPRRRYDSTRRRRSAELTQRRVLAAAERLFLDRGYARTSIPDIGREADASAQSVYASFGSKRALLMRLVDISVAGDEAPVPLLDRGWYRRLLAEPDPARMLRRHAASVREILERVAPLLVVMRQAAGSDTDVAADYYANTRQQRYESQRVVADALAERHALRRHLDADTASDILWTLSSPETYEALVLERRWSPATYETWLADTLIATLLDAEP
jgi:AcrR family transcriptional regulator